MAQIKASLIYFLLVYLASFALGTLREFFVTPYVGLTQALLIELPIMATITFFAALFVIDRAPGVKNARDRFVVGCIALILLMAAEEAMMRILDGISILTLWAHVTPLAMLAKLTGLILFVAMPLFVRRKPARRNVG